VRFRVVVIGLDVGDGIFSCFELCIIMAWCVSRIRGRHLPLYSSWSLDDLSAAAATTPSSSTAPCIFEFKWKVNQIL
jgi:hypothetical protein